MVCDLLSGLASKGVESVLFCTDDEGELYESAPAVAKACGHRKPGFFIIDWRVVANLVRFVGEHQVTLLHAHNHAPNLYCTIVSIVTGVPIVVTRHGRGYSTQRWVFLTRLLALRARTVVFVSGDAQRLAIVNHSVPAKKSIVISNGVNTRQFVPMVPEVDSPMSAVSRNLGGEMAISLDAVVIGSVGRLAPEKNYSLLVKAFARLVNVENANGDTCGLYSTDNHEPKTNNIATRAYLLLVGDGSARGTLEAELDRLNLRKYCHITGMVSDVRPWLGMMDVFCLSSDTEGLSISLLEACACGLPSVVTDVGGNREVVVDEETGILVPKGDEQALSIALERLVDNTTLRKQMGVKARERVEDHYSLSTMIKEYAQIYQDAGAGCNDKGF